ncbi:MAG: type II toxin-antitoxin system VapC family toxin [Spirochaetia bacterium]|jgi:tRNA(fMet)-specific endonuclease VapC|nr:type II toxin-antitoxin system VapC family toxin [Spirochaetia bacterium]
MKIMIDTNAYSAFKRGNGKTLEILARADEILVPVPVLGELRAGFRFGNREEDNLKELDDFLFTPRVKIQPMGEETALFYSEIFSTLKKAGRPVPVNDLWIAASALESGSILISSDAHFDFIPGIIRK